jgi:hypothetical protein
MPNSILSSVLNTLQFRVYDERNGSQIWKSIGILDVQYDAESANSQKPISNIQFSEGATYDKLQSSDIEDSKIIRPSFIKIIGMVPDITTTEAILSAWNNVFLTFTVMSRSVIAEGMTVTNVTIEQTPEWISADRITIEMEQVALPSFSGYRPKQAADRSPIGLRIQTPTSVADTITTIYNRVKSFTGVF